MDHVIIGTRRSPLAIWQADFVRAALEKAWPALGVELKALTTTGDRATGQAAQEAATKGLFTREIELALLEGSIDLAVHSLKDLPTEMTEGLHLAAVPPREDPADALVAKNKWTLESLPQGAKILCGSQRRAAQLLARRKDLRVLPIHGNVGTRIRKLDDGDADATILACAGLTRLDLTGRITQRLDPQDFLPAAGQGALAVQIRTDDRRMSELTSPLDHAPSRLAVTAERAFLAGLGGGCRLPTGAYGRFGSDGELLLTGLAARPDGSLLLKRTVSISCRDIPAAEAMGLELARRLLAEGADEILRQAGSDGPPSGEERT
jgi:hydroxymethylbilane synthase